MKKKDENIALPVMVFIYGGAFVKGSASLAEHGPDLLVQKDVIVVMFNHK